MKIGVCYYPEQWPEAQWVTDARQMHTLGIRVVRIGEFAWSRLEPAEGQLALEWLQRAIDTLAAAGLEVVLGTPTATPPKWLINKYPDILAVSASGSTRGLGRAATTAFHPSPIARNALALYACWHRLLELTRQ